MNPFDFIKNIPGIEARIREVNNKMRDTVVEGSAGAGLIRIRMNCALEVVEVGIDPAIFKAERQSAVEVLLASAFNSAIAAAKAKTQELAGAQTAAPPFGTL